jgi:hypothetical protein
MLIRTGSGGTILSDNRWLLLTVGLVGLAFTRVYDDGALAISRAGPGPRQHGYIDALTYNIAGLPEGVSEAHPASSSGQISPLLNAFDVVFLQEDFCYHEAVTAAADHPFRTVPQLALATLVNDGLTHLSRFPLCDFQRVRWPAASGVLSNYNDCLASKGFSVATAVLTEGVRLDLYNLHGDAGDCGADQEARRTSYQFLAQFLARHSAGHAVIVAGDFNLDLAGAVDRDILQELLDGTHLQDVGFALGDRSPCLDRFLFRASASVELTPVALADAVEFKSQDGAPLSDHPAMRARWQWRLRSEYEAARPAVVVTAVGSGGKP